MIGLMGVSGSEQIAIAERDEVVTGSGEAIKRIAAVLVVLLDEQIFRPAGQALVDDRLEVEIAFPDLRELNDTLKCLS